MLSMRDVIITGLPRSGATLAAALMDGLPDSACLNAPQWQDTQARKFAEPIPFCKFLIGDYIWRRRQIVAGKAIDDFRAADGTPLTDGSNDARQPRDSAGKPQKVPFLRHGLSSNFRLGMKANVLYTAMLPQLAESECFDIIVVLRNPVDAILSWFSQEHMLASIAYSPGIDTLWPELHQLIMQSGETVETCAQIAEMFHQRYYDNRGAIKTIYLHEILEQPKRLGEIIGVKESSRFESLVKPSSTIYSQEMRERVAEKMHIYGTTSRFFFPDL